MLETTVFNVGDGDSILIRERREGERDYVMLADCGRPCLEFVKGSRRQEAVYHLKREGIDRIDLMLLSHLHIDHIGGALNVLRHIPVERIESLYLPPADAGWITPPCDSDEKAVVGLCHMLNLYSDILNEAVRRGATVERAMPGTRALTDRLHMTAYLPDAELTGRQRALFDALYRGCSPDRDEWYEVSKERNCSSVIARLEYAGRSVLLTGDSYGSYWEPLKIPHTDIVKLPHHGDDKSVTEPLIRRLSPEYAVISCQNDTSTKKDRSCDVTVRLAQRYAGALLCTENKELPTLKASAHECVRITIAGDGSLECRTD